MLVNDFRTGKLGKITLEAVPEAPAPVAEEGSNQ